MGSIVITLLSVRVSVSQSSKFLRDRSLVLSETLHEVGAQLIKKSDIEGIFKKKILSRGQSIKNLGFFDISLKLVIENLYVFA